MVNTIVYTLELVQICTAQHSTSTSVHHTGHASSHNTNWIVGHAHPVRTKALIFKYVMFLYIVFRVKKLISELKMMLMFLYCTVLYNLTIMYNDIHFFHNVVCCFNGFWEQETPFCTQNNAIVNLLYNVQFFTIMYSKMYFFYLTVN